MPNPRAFPLQPDRKPGIHGIRPAAADLQALHGANSAATVRSLPATLLWAALLVGIDSIWLGQGIWSLLVAVWQLVVSLPLSYSRKYQAVRRLRLRNIAIYLGAAALGVGAMLGNAALARHRAEGLVKAIEAFHAQQGSYPRNLDELVPGQLEAVPLARYTLSFNRFSYSVANGHPMLTYVALPPFGRPFYAFETRSWGYLD